MKRKYKIFGIVGLIFLLIGCASESTTRKRKSAQNKTVQRDWVMEIRTEAASLASAVEVIPLQDPLLADLFQQARKLEGDSKFEQADAILIKASSLSIDDPQILQWRAEIALARKRWQAAFDLSKRAYELGPKLGELCLRNQLTMGVRHFELKDQAAYQESKTRALACKVNEPARY